MNLRIGTIYRYSRSKAAKARQPQVDGLDNFYYVTHRPGHKNAQLESGINPIAPVSSPNGKRRPAILIGSNPFKAGSRATPWQDVFNIETGNITYFGDNKSPNKSPQEAKGNKVLLHEFQNQETKEQRLNSAPLLFFKAVQHESKSKGHHAFMGIGVIEKVQLVTQYAQKLNLHFANYRFDIATFDMSKDNESFNWEWITDRSNKSLTDDESLVKAPQSWKDWVHGGNGVLERVRRHVLRVPITDPNKRKPSAGDAKVLDKIYKRFDGHKTAFELLAMRITGRIIKESGGHFEEGWVSKQGGDRGVDFVGKLVLGTDFATTNLVVLGQAKCVKPDTTTPGLHLSRTVSRLRRGWIGSFVTTNQFTREAQAEVIEDEYPLMLIDGLRVAIETQKLAQEAGAKSVDEYLDSIIGEYESVIRFARPEQILDAN